MVAPEPFFTPTGTPINTLQMCRALTQLGYVVHLATLPLGDDIEVPNLIYHRTLRLSFIKKVPVGFSLGKAIYDVALAFTVVRLMFKHKFIAVHAIEESAFYAVPIARFFGAKAVIDLDSDLCQQLRNHPSRIARFSARLAEPIQRMTIRASTCAVTVAPYLRELVERVSLTTPVFEITDIPIDSAVRQPELNKLDIIKRELGLEGDHTIVYTGNFDHRQGVHLLVAAMRLVRERIPDAKLLLVGGEPVDIDEMRAFAKAENVSEQIIFAGKQPLDLMPEYMALADVLISPRIEPQVTPLKIFTYMASGRPIVATELPTHTDVLDERSAILIAPSTEGIAQGIIRSFEDPQSTEKLAIAAKQQLEQKHTYEIFKEQLGEVYASLEA